MFNFIPPVNDVELDRSKLIDVLEFFGYRVGEHFSHPIRLVVHGGACMLLHPGLYNLAKQQAKLTPSMPIRKTTRDVDYIHRAFVNESLARGEPGAPEKLLICIRETAVRFRLGADWMNSAADVALPMATDPTGRQVDPVYTASIQKTNMEFHTIFSAANGMLRLVSVAPFWAVSFKLVRYSKWDPYDICLLLKYGTVVDKGSAWNRENLEQWLHTFCWSMGYASYSPEKKAQMRGRIKHAITMVNEWFAITPTLDEFRPIGFRTDPHMRQPDIEMPIPASREMVMGTKDLDGNRAEWGGGDRTGWKASFAGDWVKPHEKPVQPHLHQFAYPSLTHPHVVSNQPFSSSPLNTPPDHSSVAVEPQSRPRVSSNVADWYAEKKREKQRELEKEVKKEPEADNEEVVVPFNPLLSLSANERSPRGSSENVLGFQCPNPVPTRPELQHRAYSHPIPVPKTQPFFLDQGIYRTFPLFMAPNYQHEHSVHQTPPLYGPPAFILNPMHASAQTIPPPPASFYSSTEVKADRRAKGKARDRTRKWARSAKWRQTHSTSPDSSWHLLEAEQASSPSDTESDDEDEFALETPESTPPQSNSPAVYPLTTVVYYNQYQEQRDQKRQERRRQKQERRRHEKEHQRRQHHPPPPPKSSPPQSSPPQSSPPHFSQIYYQMAPPAQPTWASPSIMHAHEGPQPSQLGMPRFMSPFSTAGPCFSQPVIPPEEYTKSHRSVSAIQKLVTALKI